MIVDDEPFMLEGMRLMVDWPGCGFELCGEAASAQEALRLVDTLCPHLLVTDVRMPGMLGTDLAAIVSHYHPEVLILFFSGFRDFAYAQSAIRSRAFGYLVKPIDADEVHDTLRRARAELDSRAAREAAAGNRPAMLRDQVLRRIALGDDSAESMMRAAALLGIKRSDPCYCAVLACGQGPVPERATLLLDACGAVPFQIAPDRYGLGFQQIERDLPRLERLLRGLSGGPDFTLSVGRVYRGAEGFGRSLREALDAQDVLFEPHRGLRLYRPFDAKTAAWLAGFPLAALHDALKDPDPGALKTALCDLRRRVADDSPDPFALRCMAASLDAMLSDSRREASGSRLRALWQTETLARDVWLAAFAAALRGLQSIAGQGEAGWPAPVRATITAIRTRYAQPLSLGDIAGELAMNPAYLGQLVRRHAGATFHRLLLDERIERACALLRQTSRPVGEVALAVGFRDVDYFSQQFRGRMGMSPLAYRGAEAAGEERHVPRE